MKISSFRPWAVVLPAVLLLASCGKDDPKPASSPDQGRVLFVNAAAHIAPTTLRFVVDNNEKASLGYGAGNSYQSIQAGSRSVQVMASTQTALTQPIAVEKDRSYTFVAKPAASTSVVEGALFADDLTAPAAGKAKIRVINVGQSLTTPIRLAQTTAVTGGGIIVNDVSGSSASAFTEFNPGNNYSLFISDNTNKSLVQVGDGSGSGAGTRNFEANKIYTVLVTGTLGSLNDNQKLKAFVFQN
ncbi:DUF4397 domain-containing protein [uncultured Hymenobacter sp.]|uniref:DUF4397 domain-containing protein n=1 Tax=uncultured Hymenobacter sp. TaxID=170016 RepID=UPI0035CB87EC